MVHMGGGGSLIMIVQYMMTSIKIRVYYLEVGPQTCVLLLLQGNQTPLPSKPPPLN